MAAPVRGAAAPACTVPAGSHRRVEILMAVAIVLVSGTVVHPWTAQPSSRYLLTVAVVDDHSVRLDRFRDLLRVDFAEFDGHVYSDKAPYQPLLASPFYLLYRSAGGDAFPDGGAGPDPDGGFHHGRWWVTFWSATVAALALAVVMRRTVHGVHPEVATPVALALSLGTIVLPFSALLFGHVLAAALLAGAWALIRTTGPGRQRLVAGGALLGAAVGTEYPVAVPAGILLVVTFSSFGARGALRLVAGAAVASVPLLVYNRLTFGSPFTVSYQGHLPNFEGAGALGVYNLKPPILEELLKAMVGDRGLLTLTPVALCAVIGAVVVIAGKAGLRRDGVIAVVMLGTMWVLSAGVDGYGGASPGPRYLIPVVPFLAVPLAEAWSRAPKHCAVAAVLGCLAMVTALLTNPLAGSDNPNAPRAWVELALEGRWARSIPGELWGHWALLVVVGSGLLVAAAAVVVDRHDGISAGRHDGPGSGR